MCKPKKIANIGVCYIKGAISWSIFLLDSGDYGVEKIEL